MSELSKPRIVCAAVRSLNGGLVCSARHYDARMLKIISLMKDSDQFHHLHGDNQGFIDQHGKYYTREEAWIIASENKQIIRNVSKEGVLYSENLY